MLKPALWADVGSLLALLYPAGASTLERLETVVNCLLQITQ
jgi:hypothetical protein